MKFNPQTNQLFTDDGVLIKVLQCPEQQQWEQMQISTSSPQRYCDECSRTVLDTSSMKEDDVVVAVRADPSTCLCVSMRQANIQITPFISTGPSDATNL